jgi:hypothetical protein
MMDVYAAPSVGGREGTSRYHTDPTDGTTVLNITGSTAAGVGRAGGALRPNTTSGAGSSRFEAGRPSHVAVPRRDAAADDRGAAAALAGGYDGPFVHPLGDGRIAHRLDQLQPRASSRSALNPIGAGNGGAAAPLGGGGDVGSTGQRSGRASEASSPTVLAVSAWRHQLQRQRSSRSASSAAASAATPHAGARF